MYVFELKVQVCFGFEVEDAHDSFGGELEDEHKMMDYFDEDFEIEQTNNVQEIRYSPWSLGEDHNMDQRIDHSHTKERVLGEVPVESEVVETDVEVEAELHVVEEV